MPTLSAFRTVWIIASLAALASAMVASLVPPPLAAPSTAGDAQRIPLDRDVRGGDSNEIVASGVLTDVGGRPLRRGVVTVLASDGTHLDWGRVDEDGMYKLALPGEGRYVLVASADGWATTSQFVDATGTTLPQVTLTRPLQLTGRVIGASGDTHGLPVTLIKHSGEHYAGTMCDDEGNFVMPLPAPGRYIVTALASEREESAAASITVVNEPVEIVLELHGSRGKNPNLEHDVIA